MAKPHFLNVDLEILSSKKLDRLADELNRKTVVLYNGRFPRSKKYFLCLESIGNHRNPDAAIMALCSAIKNLSPTAMNIWYGAAKKFDVGYEFTSAERSSQFSLSLKALKEITDLGAELAVAYYRGE